MGDVIIRHRHRLGLLAPFHRPRMPEPLRREQKHAFRPPFHRDVPVETLRRGRWDEIAYSDSKLQNP
jgi:hypothetical protein